MNKKGCGNSALVMTGLNNNNNNMKLYKMLDLNNSKCNFAMQNSTWQLDCSYD